MTSYVDRQIARSRQRIADAEAGKGLRDTIRKLQERSAIKDSLKPLPARGAITAKTQKGKRVAASGLSTEVRELTSSDGLFVLVYQHVLGV